MRLKPLKGHVLMMLDPEIRSERSLILPDQDFIPYCKRCTKFSTGVTNGPCEPRNEWRWSPEEQTYVVAHTDTDHEIEYAEAPAVGEKVRTGMILSSSSRLFDPGERIMIDFCSGADPDEDGDSPFRIVHENAVLAMVE